MSTESLPKIEDSFGLFLLAVFIMYHFLLLVCWSVDQLCLHCKNKSVKISENESV